MKRITSLFCVFALCCALLCGCGGIEESAEEISADRSDITEVSEIMSEDISEPGSGIVPTGEIKLETGKLKLTALLNTAPDADCVRVYNHYYGSITPKKDARFTEIVVKNRKVVYIGPENERLVILPDCYVISFCGTCADMAKELKVGDKSITAFGSINTLPADRAVIDGKVFRISGVNTERGDLDVVLYTPGFGESTRTSGKGYEYVIVDGKVTDIREKSGDTDIPEHGYVISFGPKATRPEDPKDAEVFVSCGSYSVTELKINAYNAVRQQDFLVIYRGTADSGTNPYGYEVQVDKDGVCTGEVYGGSAAIPSGGYVISGHGTNETALKAAYSYGAKAALDTANDTVIITQTPMMEYDAALELLAKSEAALKNARASFTDIDYPACDSLLEKARSLMDLAAAKCGEEDFVNALSLAHEAKNALSELEFRMIPSRAVEDHAAWYRSYEKSDTEVRAILEKARSMNINALYIETFYYGYTIGYSSVPGIGHNPANGDYDALEGFCRLAKEYGIEIHAWVQNFCIGLTQRIDSEPECLMNTLPVEKRLIDRAGHDYYPLASGGFVFLDPYDEENRALILAVYEELLANYDIAGIHLDYIRFPELFGEDDYGYNDDIIEAFKRESGFEGDMRTLDKNGAVYRQFCAFRRNIITSFVGEVFDLVMRVKPQAWLSAAVYPDTEYAKNVIFQDVKTWVDNGWIDEVFSMTYSGDNSYVRSNVQSFVSFTGQKCFYSTGLSGFSGTRKEILAGQFDIAREAGSSGSALFAITGKKSESWLRNAEEYTRLMGYGAFSRPAVQAYKLAETLAAQIDDFFRKKAELYGDAYVYSGYLDERLNALKAECLSFTGGGFAERYAFAETAFEEIRALYNGLRAETFENENAACRKAVLGDLTQMRYCIERMMNRLKARIES